MNFVDVNKNENEVGGGEKLNCGVLLVVDWLGSLFICPRMSLSYVYNNCQLAASSLIATVHSYLLLVIHFIR